ncbi:MAG: 2-C-methyl-D-erythritol 2,4-cyclodiphosphate synthase [Muribaculaceae bacterium]|nr:2-C-methyl-D-erythritol 2,4-cyclodiphosphate synthase [Muribaculaceae bacterium]
MGKPTFRTGTGFDVHRLTEGRRCIIGGVEIPYEKGLLGHSDADVAIHALIDALLGAAALGDIGAHFPDTDPEWKDVDSRKLLRGVRALLEREGWGVGNVDVSIIAQAPKMRPYIAEMQSRIATDLCVEPGDVSVKATTTERLGFTGRGEGIAAQASALIYRI